MNQQHDVVEFSQHILHQAAMPMLQGQWIAIDMGLRQVVDRHSTLHPIILDLPVGEHLLQDLVEAWSAADCVCGLTQAPQCLVLQVRRFHFEGALLCKTFAPVAVVDKHLQIPICNAETLERGTQPYRVSAVIQHTGPRLSAGHYQACLDDGGESWLLTDDNRSAQPVTALEQTWSNAYCKAS